MKAELLGGGENYSRDGSSAEDIEMEYVLKISAGDQRRIKTAHSQLWEKKKILTSPNSKNNSVNYFVSLVTLAQKHRARFPVSIVINSLILFTDIQNMQLCFLCVSGLNQISWIDVNPKLLL